MFENLSDNLGKILDKLKGRGIISDDDLNAALREVRIALLEADVALMVAKNFIERVREKAAGQEVVRSVSPATMVIKIVHDELALMLGENFSALNLSVAPPAVILMAGLQGSGKTTTTAKLALRLKEKQHKKSLVASLDIYRPAAQEQLEILAKKAGITALPIIPGEKPLAITERALREARLGGFDVLLLDSAGRLHIDAEMLEELKRVKETANPAEILLVADSMTGQDAANIARWFNEEIGITGIVLTRMDGDARGGAALSMKTVTGRPIKFVGVGEKLSDLEEFHPERAASRILGMGDIVSLVEKAAEAGNSADAEKMARRLKKGEFDFEDLADQIRKLRKMGGLSSMMNLIPGIGKIKKQIDAAGVDEKIIDRQLAIINSMTRKERRWPKLLNASRKRRIAAGSGTTIQEINRLIKQHQQMSGMMKKFSRLDKKELMRGGLAGMLGQS